MTDVFWLWDIAAAVDGRAPALKQLLRPEALEVFAEWKAKTDKVR